MPATGNTHSRQSDRPMEPQGSKGDYPLKQGVWKRHPTSHPLPPLKLHVEIPARRRSGRGVLGGLPAMHPPKKPRPTRRLRKTGQSPPKGRQSLFSSLKSCRAVSSKGLSFWVGKYSGHSLEKSRSGVGRGGFIVRFRPGRWRAISHTRLPRRASSYQSPSVRWFPTPVARGLHPTP